jgi:hypothetical protein
VYKEESINIEYITKEQYLEYCLEKQKFPNVEEFKKLKKIKKKRG